jgi:uncharacterized protein (TIGR02117 family)
VAHRRARARPAVLAVLLALACSTPVTPGAPFAPAPASRSIWVVSHGWHLGLAVARADVAPGLWPERDDLGPLAFLEVGWGDGEYYPAERGTVGQALRAAFRSSGSVLHVAAFDRHPTQYFAGGDVTEIRVSTRGFEGLCRFIAAHYAKDDSGRAIAVGPGLYGPSRFYRAHGQYRLLDNSNHWTARALQSAGVPLDPDAALTAGQVLAQLRALGRGR